MLTIYCERLLGRYCVHARRVLQLAREVASVAHVRQREDRREREVARDSARLEHLTRRGEIKQANGYLSISRN